MLHIEKWFVACFFSTKREYDYTEKRYVENDIKSDCTCSDEKSLLKYTYFYVIFN